MISLELCKNLEILKKLNKYIYVKEKNTELQQIERQNIPPLAT